MSPQDFMTDTVVLSVVSTIGYFFKVYFKPNEAEAKLLSRILLGIGMVVTGMARRWMKEHKEHLDSARGELAVLRSKIKRSRIEPLG